MIPVAAAPNPLVIAHRGGAKESVENSFASLKHTWDLGVRHYETDVQLTADGRVVLMHDGDLERCYGHPGTVSEYSYEQLLRFPNASGEPVPLLSEALERYPDMYFNIDAKTEEVLEPLLAVLAEADAFDRVLVSSFSEGRLKRVRAKNLPGLCTSLGVGGVVRLVGGAATGMGAAAWGVPGVEKGVRAAQVPTKHSGIPIVTKRFIAAAHKAGLAVHVWTVNDPDEMNRLFDWGVDGVVTDVPSVAKQILVDRGQWVQPDR